MLTEKQRTKLFKEISDEYEKEDEAICRKEGSVIKTTDLGFYVPSSMRQVYGFFERIKLDRYKSFIDLGAGDGRIVLIASLFTKAAGIEIDEELYRKSIEKKDWLGMDVSLKKGDYMEHDLSQYDVVYMYPDDFISPELNEKLKEELKGILLLFSDTFLPEGLEIKEMKIDFMKFCICRNPKNI